MQIEMFVVQQTKEPIIIAHIKIPNNNNFNMKCIKILII